MPVPVLALSTTLPPVQNDVGPAGVIVAVNVENTFIVAVALAMQPYELLTV